jgi:alkylation response protein AidB-like acyl-CoA dehydrogenase
MTAIQSPDLLDELRSLAPLLRAEATDLDTARALPARIVDELRNRGVFRLLAPAELGGAEIDPLIFLHVVEETAYADGSVGWCTMIGGCYATFAGLLPPRGAREIYGDERTISAGAFRPSGVAHPVPGGYRVSGRWQLGSGSSHADWFLGGCLIVDDADGAPAPAGRHAARLMFFPASAVEVIDTWDATGLRGTASHDYSVRDLFVPASRTMWFSDPPTIDRSLYRMPVVGLFAAYVAAVPLGIGRHALEAFRALAASKTAGTAPATLASRPLAQANLGRAEATVTAGRTSLLHAVRQVWENVQRGQRPNLADHRSLWVAATYAAQAALDATEMLYATAGSTSVYASCPLDRCLRDVRTAVQHVVLQETNFEHFGRGLLAPEGEPGPWIMDYRGADLASRRSDAIIYR